MSKYEELVDFGFDFIGFERVREFAA